MKLKKFFNISFLSRHNNKTKTDYQTNSLNANLNEITVEPDTVDGLERSDENPQQVNSHDYSLAIILQKLSSLKNTIQEIKGEVKDVKGKVEKLDEKVEKLRTENGHIFEMIARNEIAKKHGQHYSECFVVFDINGLVRLSTPKEKLSSEELEYENQASILEHRTNKIANHIFVSDDS
ncbi:uncharacterized protein OCT59_011644 [Rhizophagus irregularis]|uniref:Uncharacterized protein n=1 Tax=Rhizophagus irregularis TaxID=588596 RepID=A0A915ZJI3_9GLOM|nr:hypothetical protein OCT59_011644 [Rhizophagus irregularis]CAB4474830.1 unnamed protein product [Rhizophagus irregularis]CAB5377213.1 unnamed protein product [Rhizophagus irregularis]